MKFSIVIRDSACYDFDTDEITVEKALSKAQNWFDERMREVTIITEKEEE